MAGLDRFGSLGNSDMRAHHEFIILWYKDFGGKIGIYEKETVLKQKRHPIEAPLLVIIRGVLDGVWESELCFIKSVISLIPALF